MSQWSVRVRTAKIELWTVEAESREEAMKKAKEGDILRELDQEIVDWEPISATEDK